MTTSHHPADRPEPASKARRRTFVARVRGAVAVVVATLVSTGLGAASSPASAASAASAASVTARAVAVPVLMYHLVDGHVPTDAVGRDLTVEPAAFEAQMRYLRDHRIATLTSRELDERLARHEPIGRAVVLTFDDGYEDAATVATPIMTRYGARGTFFISAGFVGTPRHASWRELRTMARAGMEDACHGTMHLDLTTLDAAGKHREIDHCEATLLKYLGTRPVSYAYPAGKYDDATIAVVRAAGLHVAWTEEPGVVRDLHAPYALPRRRVRHDTDLTEFAGLVTP